ARPSEPRTSRARQREPFGSASARPRPLAPASTPAALATRSSRSRRRRARGSSGQFGVGAGARSGTRRSGRDLAGLPREPGRGFCQDRPLLAERSNFTAKASELVLLPRRQAVTPLAGLPIGLLHPIPNALVARLELLRKLRRATPGSNQLHQPTPQLRRVGGRTLRHRERLRFKA